MLDTVCKINYFKIECLSVIYLLHQIYLATNVIYIFSKNLICYMQRMYADEYSK